MSQQDKNFTDNSHEFGSLESDQPTATQTSQEDDGQGVSMEIEDTSVQSSPELEKTPSVQRPQEQEQMEFVEDDGTVKPVQGAHEQTEQHPDTGTGKKSQKQRYKAHIQTLKQENQRYEEKAASLEAELEKVRADVIKQRTEHSEKETQADQRKIENDKLKRQNATLTKEVQQWKNDVGTVLSERNNLQAEKNELKKEKGKREKQLDKVEKEKEKWKSDVGKLTNMKLKLEQALAAKTKEVEDFQAAYKLERDQFDNICRQNDSTIQELSRKNTNLNAEKEKLSGHISNLRRMLEAHAESITSLREEKTSLEAEKQNLLLRLSKLAGANLTYNNPNIADLSDEKRPTKLSEEFSELYDNEWTDAFEDVNIKDDKEKTTYMLKLLQRANELCHEVSREHFDSIKGSFSTITLKAKFRSKPVMETLNGQINNNESEIAKTDTGAVTQKEADAALEDKSDDKSDSDEMEKNEESNEEKACDQNEADGSPAMTDDQADIDRTISKEYHVISIPAEETKKDSQDPPRREMENQDNITVTQSRKQDNGAPTGEKTTVTDALGDTENTAKPKMDFHENRSERNTENVAKNGNGEKGTEAVEEINENETLKAQANTDNAVAQSENGGKGTEAVEDIKEKQSLKKNTVIIVAQNGNDEKGAEAVEGIKENESLKAQGITDNSVAEGGNGGEGTGAVEDIKKKETLEDDTDLTQEIAKGVVNADRGGQEMDAAHIQIKKDELDFERLTNEQKKTISEARKFFELKLSKEVEMAGTDLIIEEHEIDEEKQKFIKLYIQKCVNLCWSMCRHEPAVYVEFIDINGDVLFDSNKYKPYTKTGKHLDFIVWPTLYLHKDGPMLSKGVAQGK